LRAYVPTSSLTSIESRPYQTPFKLDWNESTIPPSPAVTTAIQRHLAGKHHLNWYPEVSCGALRSDISDYVGHTASGILVTNGSDDALDLVCRTYLDEGDEVVLPVPTYTHFEVFAGASGGQLIPVRSPNPLDKNIGGVLSAIGPRTKLIYLVSPTNPTGIVYSEADVREVLASAPHAVVVVDEAYHEFCGYSVAHLTREFENLVVTRTFSKSFGIAGLRVGYALASPGLIGDLLRLYNPKSVNALGQVAARAALQDLDHLAAYVSSVRVGMEMMQEFFQAHGITCHGTPANFVLVSMSDPSAFARALAEVGVYVRDWSDVEQMEHLVRMSVGTAEQTEEVLRRVSHTLERMPRLLAN
jgi:histidinol-phosphate aminotransferase